MANNYLQFSIAVDNLTDQEMDWWKEKIQNEIKKDQCEDDGPCGADFTLDLKRKEVWVCAEESGNVEYVAYVMQEFLAAFRSDKHVILTWAETCSRPILDSFTGGGVLISATGQEWFVPNVLIEQALKNKA